ncbi:MAG: shikimate kinase [Armatimonadota bacterium]
MKLICIYGPPASGKLTVARELSSITGIKVFHNHLALDFAAGIFDWGMPAFWSVVESSIMLVLETAAKTDTDLIFTFVYSPEDDSFIGNIVQTVEDHGGEVCFVQLSCTPEVLEERVLSPDRQQFKKISSVETLRDVMCKRDIFASAPYEGLQIDTCQMIPPEAARVIAVHFGLQIIS